MMVYLMAASKAVMTVVWMVVKMAVTTEYYLVEWMVA